MNEADLSKEIDEAFRALNALLATAARKNIEVQTYEKYSLPEGNTKVMQLTLKPFIVVTTLTSTKDE